MLAIMLVARVAWVTVPTPEVSQVLYQSFIITGQIVGTVLPTRSRPVSVEASLFCCLAMGHVHPLFASSHKVPFRMRCILPLTKKPLDLVATTMSSLSDDKT